eukprot:TRINITY_DN1224_c0_g1_i3.p1 TRINITY_DN1224_c0_g1~~TRINITY_DN1224_c0_g1_i3.p1  ORF type:complete len:435 (+),score=40.62 TRINITY_DN1224_c0_g1_i3:127-1305(+)
MTVPHPVPTPLERQMSQFKTPEGIPPLQKHFSRATVEQLMQWSKNELAEALCSIRLENQTYMMIKEECKSGQQHALWEKAATSAALQQMRKENESLRSHMSAIMKAMNSLNTELERYGARGRYAEIFGLPEEEGSMKRFFCKKGREPGFLFIGSHHVCFNDWACSSDERTVLDIRAIESVRRLQGHCPLTSATRTGSAEEGRFLWSCPSTCDQDESGTGILLCGHQTRAGEQYLTIRLTACQRQYAGGESPRFVVLQSFCLRNGCGIVSSPSTMQPLIHSHNNTFKYSWPIVCVHQISLVEQNVGRDVPPAHLGEQSLIVHHIAASLRGLVESTADLFSVNFCNEFQKENSVSQFHEERWLDNKIQDRADIPDEKILSIGQLQLFQHEAKRR